MAQGAPYPTARKGLELVRRCAGSKYRGLSSGRLLRSTKTSLLNFRGALRHLLDVVSVSRNGPGKWFSRQYSAPRALLLGSGTGRSNLELSCPNKDS